LRNRGLYLLEHEAQFWEERWAHIPELLARSEVQSEGVETSC
jgi:hypothetical protein